MLSSSTYESPGDLVTMQVLTGRSGIGHEIVNLQQAPPVGIISGKWKKIRC